MSIGWPLVTFFVLFVAAALAELASAIPTSGALYHWASLLGGPTWGWITAWLNLVGLIAAIAGIDYGCAQFMTPLLGLRDTPGNFMLVFAALLVSHATLNHIGIRTVARLNDFSAVYHVAGVAVVVLALAFFAPKQPLSWFFTETFTTIQNQPCWFAFLGGLLQAQWTYTGYDASAHTIEETTNARVRRRGASICPSRSRGRRLRHADVRHAGDQRPRRGGGRANPFIYIFEQALGSTFGRLVLWIVTLAMWFCGLSCVTSTSRMIFAFARDGGMPLSRIWANVGRYRTRRRPCGSRRRFRFSSHA